MNIKPFILITLLSKGGAMILRILAGLVLLACLDASESHAQFTQEWARIYPSAPSEFAEAVDVQVDAAGNIFTLGLVANDMLLIKYNPAGDTLWTRRVANSGRPLKFELDRNANPVIVGASPGIRKYNSNGSLMWTRSVPDAIYTLSLDSLDNVLVGTASLIDVTAYKYSSNGDSLWRREYPASGFPTASTTDGAGNFYLAASVFVAGSGDILVIKHTPAGDTAWVRSYDRMGFSEYPSDIEVDNQGNVVVAGYSSTNGQLSGKDYAVVKYNPTGELLWQRHFDGPANDDDQINDIDLDEDGNTCATGRMTDATGFVAGTMKLSASGDSLWATYGVSLGSSNAVGGGSDGYFIKFLKRETNWIFRGAYTDQVIDIATIQSDNGGLVHKTTYGAPNTETVSSRRIVPWFLEGLRMGSTLEVVLAAHRVSFFPPPPTSFLHTVKFSSPITGVDNEGMLPTSFALYQNYPNPFNPTTRIKYQIPNDNYVTLKVFDILGREVRTLVNETRIAGEHEVTFDANGLARQTAGGLASGVYFYRLMSSSITRTRRMILQR